MRYDCPLSVQIGEDMHMFIKCLFATRGDLISQTVYSPASQLDVVSAQSKGVRGYWNDHVARYRQAVRHMWGSRESIDTGHHGEDGLLIRFDSSRHWVCASHADRRGLYEPPYGPGKAARSRPRKRGINRLCVRCQCYNTDNPSGYTSRFHSTQTT